MFLLPQPPRILCHLSLEAAGVEVHSGWLAQLARIIGYRLPEPRRGSRHPMTLEDQGSSMGPRLLHQFAAGQH